MHAYVNSMIDQVNAIPTVSSSHETFGLTDFQPEHKLSPENLTGSSDPRYCFYLGNPATDAAMSLRMRESRENRLRSRHCNQPVLLKTHWRCAMQKRREGLSAWIEQHPRFHLPNAG